MLSLKFYDRLKSWFEIQPKSDKQSDVAVNQKQPDIQVESENQARRRTALQVEEDLRRIRDQSYLLRPNVF
ncbi:hypothetical protein [Nostoc sp. 106C]|uniref:hypothetical protein n=1 Tax=Nostoc sp. 106C TaxID=1932667 RepID=UPI000A39F8BB|nr:hypothetical protein [Nostoc sp. 106C]OUL18835.1 hypothetical protein BV378_34280 [Nostoc sp. RF31YmG]OUL32148.1 hypothetical protein BV375_10905 [Nostoc sp. 106C]